MLTDPVDLVLKPKSKRRIGRRSLFCATGVLVLLIAAMAMLWSSQRPALFEVSTVTFQHNRTSNASVKSSEGERPRGIHAVVSALSGSEDALVDAIRADRPAAVAF